MPATASEIAEERADGWVCSEWMNWLVQRCRCRRVEWGLGEGAGERRVRLIGIRREPGCVSEGGYGQNRTTKSRHASRDLPVSPRLRLSAQPLIAAVCIHRTPFFMPGKRGRGSGSGKRGSRGGRAAANTGGRGVQRRSPTPAEMDVE